MSKHETPMTLAYWETVGGTLIIEYDPDIYDHVRSQYPQNAAFYPLHPSTPAGTTLAPAHARRLAPEPVSTGARGRRAPACGAAELR